LYYERYRKEQTMIPEQAFFLDPALGY